MKRRLSIGLSALLVMTFAVAVLAYHYRADLPVSAAGFVMRYFDPPHYYPKNLKPPRPKILKLKSISDLEQWMTSAVLCDEYSVLDVQEPRFIHSLKKLGVKGVTLSEGTPDGEWELPPGTQVLGFPVKRFVFWADSGGEFFVIIDGHVADYAKSLGAKPSFVLHHENSPVLFSREYDFSDSSGYLPPPYTYFRSDRESMIGCSFSDG